MGGDKKKGKRKKDPNSPDFQLAQPGQKRTTMEMNGQNGGQQKQQQTQASASYMYQTFTPQQPLQPNIHYGQPYYGSPPAPAISQMPQISQMPPIPISPSVSQPQNAQNTLTQDVITKLFERLDMMDKKLGQLESIQSSLQGAQWLSGRVLDSRPKGRGFEPHRRHCVVVLEQDTFILA